MTGDELERTEIFEEIEALCIMTERITQSSECRDFYRSAALLPQRLKDAECYRLADRAMDLLASCNPKYLSQCDNIQRARDVLKRLRELTRETLKDVEPFRICSAMNLNDISIS